MRTLTLDIIENWRRLTCYQRQQRHPHALAAPRHRGYVIPATNNATENSIGRAIKVRAKLTRGFKSLPAPLRTVGVVASTAGVLAGLGFEQLIQ